MNPAAMPAPRATKQGQTAPRLRLCGDAALIVAGKTTLGAKDLVLLAYLCLEAGPHSREKLTALLWGEYPEERARGSLRQAIKHLRDAVGDAIEIDRTTLNLPRDAVACDVVEFIALAERVVVDREHAADNASLIEKALSIDVPRFLSNVVVRNGPAFDEWASATRARLNRRYARLLDFAVRDALKRSAWRDGCRLAQRWAALAPFDDDPVALLMEAQFLGGNAGEALATYVDHATHLAAEVHRAPSQVLIELAARIRRASSASHHGRLPRVPKSSSDSPSFDGPLVGRAAEWITLTDSWEKVCEGASRVVLLEGERGSGKTRLAEDFLRWVTTHGATVLRGAAQHGFSGAPHGALTDALRSGLSAPGLAGADPESLAQVARLLPELRGRFPGLRGLDTTEPARDSSRLFEGVAEVIVAIADENPLTIFIDDLHWCDTDSCSLIQFLIRRTTEVPVLWCLTFSAGEVAPDTASSRLRRALRTAAGTVGVTLGPLSEDDLWRLIRDLGRLESPSAGRRFAARLHAATAGNPFFAVELLKIFFARRLLFVDSATGRWVAGSGDGDATAPLVAQSIQDAIAERVGGLPEELHSILATIAVAGRGCTPAVLSHMHGISRLRAAALGDALVERHLLVEQNGEYRCAHPILADVIRSGLSTSRRRETHRALALSLEFLLSSSTLGEQEMGDIARHAEQGNDRSMAYRYSLLAAAASSRRSEYEEAFSWLSLAATCAETVDESQIASRRMAELLEQARWQEAPPARATGTSTPARVDLADLDLPSLS